MKEWFSVLWKTHSYNSWNLLKLFIILVDLTRSHTVNSIGIEKTRDKLNSPWFKKANHEKKFLHHYGVEKAFLIMTWKSKSQKRKNWKFNYKKIFPCRKTNKIAWWPSPKKLGEIVLTFIISSVQSLSRVRLFATPWTAARTRPPCPSPTPGVYPNSCTLSQWCHPTNSSSVVPFSSHLQSFPASGSFQMSQLFASGGQSIGVSASASVLQMNTQDWSPLGWISWISLHSKGLSRVFSNTTIQKHQFFGAQLSL